MNQPNNMTDVILENLTELRWAETRGDRNFYYGRIGGRLCALFECGALSVNQLLILTHLSCNAFKYAAKGAAQ